MPEFPKNPDGMKPSGYKMKYSNSAFPFKSPMKAKTKTFSTQEEAPKKKSRTLINKMKNKNEGYHRLIKTDMKTGETDTSYVKPQKITLEEFYN